MLIFQSADLKQPISADLPLTYRRPTADLPLTYPPLSGGSSLGSLPQRDSATPMVWMSVKNLTMLARERWGAATAFRVGIVAGELNVRMVNPYRGRLGAHYREGLRKGRNRWNGTAA